MGSTDIVWKDTCRWEDASCTSWVLVLPCINEWSLGARGVIFFFALVYLFLGITIVSDVFMSSIEYITSQERTVIRMVDGQKTQIRTKVWNATVANLTLMALGSSAPEILLATIELSSKLGEEPGELGPSTIVGSAAFNLLVINAVCMNALPKNEVKRITEIGVFGISSFFSIWAYIWIYIVLEQWSPGEVSIEESVVTLLFFPFLVIICYCQDRHWFRRGPLIVPGPDGEPQTMPQLSTPVPDHEINGKYAQDMGGTTVTVMPPGSAPVGTGSAPLAEATTSRNPTVAKAGSSGMDFVIPAAVANVSDVDEETSMAKRIKARMTATKGVTGRTDKKNQGIQMSRRRSPSVYANTMVMGHSGSLQFKSKDTAAPEDAGIVKVDVERIKGNTGKVSVQYFTQDATAVAGKDYIASSGTLEFEDGENILPISIEIIDDDLANPDRYFTITLQHPVGCELGETTTCLFTILDNDMQAVLSFQKKAVVVKETEGFVSVRLTRALGLQGEASASFFTIDGSAKHDLHFEATEGTVTFEDKEISQTIQVPLKVLLPEDRHDSETSFLIALRNPSENCVLDSQRRFCQVTVLVDYRQTKGLAKMSGLLSIRDPHAEPHAWIVQFQDAVSLRDEVDEDGHREPPSGLAYTLHFFMIFWKVLFAFIPPADHLGGWPCFLLSLVFIGGLTALVEQFATLFGCVIGLKPPVTAITFVALGTSLPDTFASKIAAQECSDADAAIGNVTGSNAVNVFLGLGVPWLIGSIYSQAKDGVNYKVNKDSISFSVAVYCIVASSGLLLLFVRRTPKLGGGELGGGPMGRAISSSFFMSAWVLYLVLSSLKAYDHI